MHAPDDISFVAIDVETANADMASICQIGLVHYRKNQLIDTWKTYVDPQDYFDAFNVHLHGIDESTVSGAPVFSGVADELFGHLDNQVVVSHTHFDRVALQRAGSRFGTRDPICTWLDSARIARRTWPDVAWGGYGLKAVCRLLGYTFQHHDALEDAKAAAHIVQAACQESGLDIGGWLERVSLPIDLNSGSSGCFVKRKGNPEGALFGETVVFTGSLSMPRREAADLAASVGCSVGASVTKNTTLLVVGNQDIRMLAGYSKSGKHRKAEEMISKGAAIRILAEDDFRELVRVGVELG
jgi:DNA polymerase III subunit epsilon